MLELGDPLAVDLSHGRVVHQVISVGKTLNEGVYLSSFELAHNPRELVWSYGRLMGIEGTGASVAVEEKPVRRFGAGLFWSLLPGRRIRRLAGR